MNKFRRYYRTIPSKHRHSSWQHLRRANIKYPASSLGRITHYNRSCSSMNIDLGSSRRQMTNRCRTIQCSTPLRCPSYLCTLGNVPILDYLLPFLLFLFLCFVARNRSNTIIRCVKREKDDGERRLFSCRPYTCTAVLSLSLSCYPLISLSRCPQ
jgi:hypothetical protein